MKKQSKSKQKMMRMYNPVTKSYYKIRKLPSSSRSKKSLVLKRWAELHK